MILIISAKDQKFNIPLLRNDFFEDVRGPFYDDETYRKFLLVMRKK